ncbi:glutaminase [Microbacterium amylolyticum]|uniref:Glutaminase n=1 Tax=Microbacterium amylolyticum TaxID=936337 RepID=A0ABS4ZH06_9MICO|nr:glutaminase [Microbacterium amylolyticum]MBP2436566.1 hypothetical protein [Microbacterium amylolyticum]
MDDLAAILGDARARLRDVPTVRLGLGRRARMVARAFGGKPVIEPVARAHHLGVVLIGQEKLWATGDIIRAAPDERRGFTAESQRVRAYMSGMAFRGGFADGETCHIDWEEIDVAAVSVGGADGPLSWRDDRIMVRWSPAGFLMPFSEYVDERIALAGD